MVKRAKIIDSCNVFRILEVKIEYKVAHVFLPNKISTQHTLCACDKHIPLSKTQHKSLHTCPLNLTYLPPSTAFHIETFYLP